MIAIVAALKREADKIIEEIKDKEEISIAGKTVFKGKLFGKDTAVIISGIGKVSAALATQAAIDRFSPEYVLNFGTAGGLGDRVKACGFYAVKRCCQHDFDLSDLDDVSRGYIQDYDAVYFPAETKGLNLPEVSLSTADRFTCKENDLSAVADMGCDVADMEGCAIAQVCLSNGVKFYCIKAVSDVIGSGTQSEDFNANMKKIAEKFPSVIKNAIERI